MTYREVFEEVKKQEEKYFDLVWYARKTDLDFIQHKEVRDHCRRIEAQYAQECENLDKEGSSWHHGFNSGMLAGMRLILEMKRSDAQGALDEFPFLDT